MAARSAFLRLRLLLITAFLVIAILEGCQQSKDYIEPPTLTVTVSRPVKRPLTDYLEFTGTTAAIEKIGIAKADIVAAQAARLRFRPVLMTAFSFIFGVMPLVFASGAGSASQQAVGTAVFGGMMASTALAVLFVPVFFVIFQRLSEFKRKSKAPDKTKAAAPSPEQAL